MEILRIFLRNLADVILGNPKFLILFILIIFAVFFSVYMEFKIQPGNGKKKHRVKTNLKYANKHEAHGVIFGLTGKYSKKAHYSPTKDEGHILCVGGSGQGKTSSLLIPTLRSWSTGKGNEKNTSLTIDISGDISKNVKMHHKLIYNPTDEKSIPYNIFATIDVLKNDVDKDKALAELALLLMPINPNASEAGAYYADMGRKILTASLIAFYHEGMDFCDICEKIVITGWQSLLNEIDDTKNERAIKYINCFEGIDEKYASSAKNACDTAVALFSTDEILKKNVRRPKKGEKKFFSAAQIETHNCFIVIPDEDLEYYQTLTQILTAQCLDFFKSRPLDADHQILFCLDEAASLGTIDVLPPLRKFRKRKVRIFFLTQSLADISLVWGEKQREAMLANFKYKIILECSVASEQREWADLIGEETIINKSRTDSRMTDVSYTISEHKDYKLSPSSLANLGNYLILLYPGGFRKLYKNFYFK